MSESTLPSRRFRSVQTLIGVTLAVLVVMVVAEMAGMLDLARRVEDDAQRGARATALSLAAHLASTESPRFLAALREEGWGVVVFGPDRIERLVGETGPVEQTFWPWPSRRAWEERGSPVAGPLPLGGHRVVVAYQTLADGRVVRVLRRLHDADALLGWRLVGGFLGLIVAVGGGALAWVLISRALAPYRELLAEAARVTGEPGEQAEDRFLVQTFRETVHRLEASEAALKRRADELTVLADVLTRGSESGVAILGPDGRVTAHNLAAGTMLGSGLTVGEPLPAGIPRVDGRFLLGTAPFEVRRLPLLGDAGERLGEVTFLTDRASIEALERTLAEREQMAQLGELAAGMAHELRNALATIRGYVRLLSGPHEDRRPSYLAAMEQEAGALGLLLDRFLRFAQPHELHLAPVDLRTVAREAVDRCAASFPTPTITLDGEPVMVSADAVAVAAIVENLVRNAAEASPGGHVWIHLRAVGDGQAELTVDDDGPGVAPEIAERLFYPFVTTKPSGGLGLALARRLARLHGGDVVWEQREGHGARFVLHLPGIPS